MNHTALVAGASGYIGAQLVPALLAAGWRVRVLARTPAKLDPAWRDRVEVRQGDATVADDLSGALAGVDVAYYLLHSMDGRGDYVTRDRDLARSFAGLAREADVGRIVYLSGLHPQDKPLSAHLGSRVEVGEILLASGVPTAVLQAGVVLGDGSASFDMLRHLAERLPAAVGPRWLRNRIQPIAVDDVVFYLVRAAELPPEVNRSFDLGMDEVLTYAEMMDRYARVAGLGGRFVGTVPLLTPGLASHWVGLVTPVSSGIARPLVGSLINDAVKHSDDATEVLGEPESSVTGFDEAVRRALRGVDAHWWRRVSRGVAAAVVATAVVGSLFTDPGSRWYQTLRKPSWQPPASAFPIAWTTLYGLIWVASASAIADLGEEGRDEEASGFTTALGVNLALNAAWSGVFFRAHALPAATLTALGLAASSADLARRGFAAGVGKGAALVPYAAWTAFATVLTASIARLNRRG